MLFSTRADDKRFWAHADRCLDNVRDLARQKSGDYNRACDVPDYLPRGWRDGVTHIWKCALRLLNVTLVPGPTHTKNEAILDTLYDIINWSRYAYALYVMEEKEGYRPKSDWMPGPDVGRTGDSDPVPRRAKRYECSKHTLVGIGVEHGVGIYKCQSCFKVISMSAPEFELAKREGLHDFVSEEA